MKAPTNEELRRVAKFDVGDNVHLHGSLKWKVVARYYSKRERRIYYDLLFERTKVTSLRHAEEELSPSYDGA